MKHLYFVFLLFLVACGPKAPTDDQLKDLSRDAGYALRDMQAEADKKKAFEEIVNKSGESFDVRKITPVQVELLFESGGIVLENYFQAWLFPVLDVRARKEGLAGAEASYLRWKYFPKQEGQSLTLTEGEACVAFMQHPVMKEFLAGNPGALTDVVSRISRLGGDKWVEYGIVQNVKSLLDIELPEEAVMVSKDLFDTAFAARSIKDAEKDEFRQKVLKQYIALRDSGKVTNKRKLQRIKSSCQYLQGAYAANTLMGNTAPELDFLWISKGEEKKLSDFRGKVVLLDFWATKCGACVEIFPNIKALTNYYAGYPVEILGITSIQGYHIDIKNQKNIETTGKPELECELMKTFMKDMDMNWKVVFTEQSVFNPEYGVPGMPHIVLIDAEGKVRYSGIDPGEMPYLKAEKMNALLREAGLPCPSKPMEQKDFRKRKN